MLPIKVFLVVPDEFDDLRNQLFISHLPADIFVQDLQSHGIKGKFTEVVE